MAEVSEPDVRFGPADRRALLSVAVQFFINGVVFASFIPRLPEVRTRLGVSVDTLGFLLTIAAGVGLVGSAISSTLVRRFGTKRVMIGGAIVLIVSLPLIGLSTVTLVVLFALAMLYTFDVVVDIAMNLQGSWLSARRHAPVMNRLHGLWSLGTVIGGVIAARAAAAGVSLATHLLVVSGVLLVTLLFVGRGLLPVDEHVATDDVVDVADRPDPVDPATTAQPSTGRLVLLAFALSGAAAITVEVASSDWAAFRLSDDLGTSAGFAVLGFVAFTTGMTIGRFSGDSILLRLGADRLLYVAVALAVIGLVGATLVPNRWVVLAAYVLAGLGVSTFFPRLYDEAAQHRGAAAGAGLGWMTAGSRVALLAVPTLVGVLAASRLSVGAAVAIVTVPSALAFLVLSMRRRP